MKERRAKNPEVILLSHSPNSQWDLSVLDMTQRDSVCACVCVFICLVVSDVHGLPEGPY